MTAFETGREIPADELVERLRSDAAAIQRLRRKTAKDADDAERYTAAADLIEAQAARIASLEAERARTVGALQTIVGGAVPRRRAEKHRADGKPSEHDRCEHGAPMYEDCGECTANYAAGALAPEKGGQA